MAAPSIRRPRVARFLVVLLPMLSLGLACTTLLGDFSTGDTRSTSESRDGGGSSSVHSGSAGSSSDRSTPTSSSAHSGEAGSSSGHSTAVTSTGETTPPETARSTTARGTSASSSSTGTASSASSVSSSPTPHDAGGTSWCASKTYDAQSCTDFDESPGIPPGWTLAADAGTIGVVSTFSESPRNSLGVSLDAGTRILSALLIQDFSAAATATTITLRFDLLVEGCAGTQYEAVAVVAFGGTFDAAVLLFPSPDGGPPTLGAGSIQHGGGSANTIPSNMVLTLGAWTPILATLDVPASTLTVSESAASGAYTSGFDTGSEVVLEMGLVELYGSCEVYVDNVTFAWGP